MAQTLKVKCGKRIYTDGWQDEVTGEIFFAGNTHRYTPVDELKGHRYPYYPKHLIVEDKQIGPSSYATVCKPCKQLVEIIERG